MIAAIYARVSTLEQNPDNQLVELRRYTAARGWTATEFIDRGVSGATVRRPALDALLHAARRRKIDVVVCWRFDRLGRNLKHLITMLDELQALVVAFVSLNECVDGTTPAGKLQMHILGAIAEFERGEWTCGPRFGHLRTQTGRWSRYIRLEDRVRVPRFPEFRYSAQMASLQRRNVGTTGIRATAHGERGGTPLPQRLADGEA